MKNTHFKLPTYITNDSNGINYKVKDIFVTYKNQKVSNEFIANNKSFWYYKDIQDNTRLELLAHTEYNDSSLWDILFVINQMDNIWDLPKSEDYVNELAQQKVDEFALLFGKSRMQETLELRTQELYQKYFDLNEKHRRFRFINKQQIPNLMELIKAGIK